ncbi:MAG: aminopeptidase P family protein [Planctomycetales bacterium]|nr:aminopeptidase P family protein [Planctomycetales bacterium]
MSPRIATIIAGIPIENRSLFHRVRFSAGDPAAWMQFDLDGNVSSLFMVRDIECERARQHVKVDQVAAPIDFSPSTGLSGDRATAVAQAVVECLRQKRIEKVTTDRTLPFIFAWHIQQAGIPLSYSPELGVIDRRQKSAEEIELLRQAQQVTENAMQMALETIGRATANSQGQLEVAGVVLTSELIQAKISAYLLEQGFANPHGSIVASLPHSADCHARGSGPLVTGQAVIVDIFPQCEASQYWGDCTRTVVHGDPSDEMVRMHAAVVEAKHNAIEQVVIGAKADDVHAATKEVLEKHGYRFARGEISDLPIMPHGTGHGIGLEVHEPILLDDNGGTILAGEALTVEPGLYSRRYGGVRVEDMVVATDQGPLNLNKLPEGLCWS